MSNTNKKRIAQAIKEKYPYLSQQFLKTLFKEGRIQLGHKIAEGKEWVQNTNQIKIDKKFLKKEISPNPNVKCCLLFQDNDYLFFEKKADVPSVCLNFQDENTAANWLLSVDQDLKNVGLPLESGLLHRLDTETSGVMVAARNEKSFSDLKKLFQKNRVCKEYVCIVTNPNIQPGIYTASVRSHPKSKKKVLIERMKRPGKNQRKIVTEIVEKKIYSANKILLKIRLVTGFRHQIRAHLSFLGSPILGDPLYGGEKAKQLFLHAQKLQFKNSKGQSYEITCPVDISFSNP